MAISPSDVVGLNPRLAWPLLWADQHIRAATRGVVSLSIVSGVRTPAEQRALFEQGRSTEGRRVTNTLNSKHLRGEAVDLSLVVNGRRLGVDDVDPSDWRVIWQVLQFFNPDVRWGGVWRTLQDSSHFELG